MDEKTTDEHGQPDQWCATAEDFLVHHPTLIRTFRGKLRDKLKAAGVEECARKERPGERRSGLNSGHAGADPVDDKMLIGRIDPREPPLQQEIRTLMRIRH